MTTGRREKGRRKKRGKRDRYWHTIGRRRSGAWRGRRKGGREEERERGEGGVKKDHFAAADCAAAVVLVN
jgi:hypothetical protein